MRSCEEKCPHRRRAIAAGIPLPILVKFEADCQQIGGPKRGKCPVEYDLMSEIDFAKQHYGAATAEDSTEPINTSLKEGMLTPELITE